MRNMNMEKRLLQEKLKELEYTGSLLKDTLEDIDQAAPDIQRAVYAYVREGTVENLAQEPVDVTFLMESYAMNPIAALLFIDWYRRAPEDALQCLALGVDTITDLPEAEEEDGGEDAGA